MLGYICCFGAFFTYTQHNTATFQAPILDTTQYTTSLHKAETVDQISYRWTFQPLSVTIPAVTTAYRIVTLNAVAVTPNDTIQLQISASTPITFSMQGQSFRIYSLLVPDGAAASLQKPDFLLTITPSQHQIVNNRSLGVALSALSVASTQPSLIPPNWVILSTLCMLLVTLVYHIYTRNSDENVFWVLICLFGITLTALNILTFTTALAFGISILVCYGLYRYTSPLYRTLTTDIPQLSNHTYRADIDGLRALAVIAVVIYHAFPTILPGGFIGVDVFFVISGYLITRIIIQELQNNHFSIRHFYVRRIRRIFPALIVTIIGTALIGMFILYQSEYITLGSHIIASAGFVSNILLYQQIDYFGELAITQPLLHLWSLGIEEQFYIVWPIVLMLASKRPRLIFPSIIVLLVASFFINIHTITKDIPAAFYLLPARFWQLGIGGVIALYSLWYRPTSISKNTQRWAAVWPMLGLFLYGIGIFVLDESLAYPGWYAILPTISGALIIYPQATNWVSQRLLSHYVLVWFGKISFPLYLWHWPLLTVGFMTLEHAFTPLLKTITIGLSIVFATATYLYIERPIRFSPTPKISTALLVLTMLGIGGMGWAIKESYIQSYLSDIDKLPKYPPGVASPCNQLLGITGQSNADEICFFRSGPKTQSEYILIGDSHARALAIGLLNATTNQVTLYSRNGCPPLMDIRRIAFACENNNQLSNIIQYLRNYPTQHTQRYVILVGRYSLIEPQSLYGNDPIYVPLFVQGVPDSELLAHPEKAIEIGLNTILTQLSSIDATSVVLFHQVPELQFLPKNCARLITLTRDSTQRTFDTLCQTPYTAVKQHFARYRSAVSQVLVNFRDVQEFTADSLFCDNSVCVASIENQLAYMDHHHLNEWGATQVARIFTAQFP